MSTNLPNRAGQQREKIERLELENARLWRGLAVFYGIGVACDRCGAPPTKPCITGTGRFTVHDTRRTKAAEAIPSDDLLIPPDFAAGPAEAREDR